MTFWSYVAEIDDHAVALVGNQAVASVLSYSINDPGRMAQVVVTGIVSGVFLVFSLGLYGRRFTQRVSFTGFVTSLA